jgi:apolipoprotein N-acyltransferase
MLGIVFLSLAVVLLIAVPTGLQLGGNQTNAIASAFIISVIYLVIYLEGAGFVGPTETDIQSWGEWWGDRSSKIKTQKETLNEATRKVREELLKPKSADTSPSAETSTGGTRISLDDPCDVPGFTWLRNSIAPSSIIISQTILLCHLMEAISNRDTETVSDTLPLAGTSLISFGLQYWLFLSKEKCGYTQKAWAPLIGYGISIVAAATSYLGLKYLAKEQFTTNKTDEGVFSNPVHKPKAKTQKDKDTTTIKVDSPGDTSLPVDDQDQFVCEAYRDGELITSTIVE